MEKDADFKQIAYAPRLVEVDQRVEGTA